MRALGLARAIWRNQRRRPDLPRFLTYIVTFTCNARCIMCDSWKKPSRDALSLDEIERIFRELPRMDGVRLSGGEPFVRPDLGDIGELARRHLDPLFLHVTTNGFLTEKIVAFCEQRERRLALQLLVSVDGIGDKHDHVRGTDDAWTSVLATLEALAPRQEELNLRLAVNQTIVDAEGVDHYRRLCALLAPLGVRTSPVLAYDASATYSLEPETVAQGQIGSFTTFGEFSQDDLRELLEAIEEDLVHYPWAERVAKRYYVRGLRSRLLEGGHAPNPKCVALSSHMRIMPNGDVPVCQFNTRKVGSLREQGFEELWRSARIEEERAWVHRCPGCWAECEVLPSAIYTGDLVRAAL